MSEIPAVRPGVRRPGLLLLAALLGLAVTLLDITVVTVALPTIKTSLHTSLADLEWVANAYLLTLGVFIVVAGRLGDVYGRRGVFATGLVVFVLGSAICGLADKLTFGSVSAINILHAGRVIQGFGGAMIIPLSLALIYAGFEGKKRTMGIMLWGAVGGLATALGPLVGGVLVSNVNWQSIFMINLPLGAIALIATLVGVGKMAPARTADGKRVRASLDLPGLLTVSAALLLLNLALIEGASWGWGSSRIVGLFVGAGVLLALFLVVESRVREPIMHLGWFRRPGFGGSISAGFLLGAGMFSMIFYLSLYLQNGLRMSAEGAGLRLLPLTAMIIFGAPLGGRLAAKLGMRTMLTFAFALLGVGIALFTLVDPHGDAGSWTLLLPGMLISGLCMGMIVPSISEVTIASAPPDQYGVASSLATMFRQVGNSVGIAVMGAVLSAQTTSAKSVPIHSAAQAATVQQEAITTAIRNMSWFAVAASALAAVAVVAFVRTKGTPADSAGELEERELPVPTVAH
jgi:EmrB/QacA subfamily drug resistance transporter